MRDMPSDSVDSIVSDPPYGLSRPPNIAEVLRHWLPEDPRIVSAIADLLRVRATARDGGYWADIADDTNAALGKLIAVVRQSRQAYKHGAAGFMGAKWDSFVPGPRVWAEALRVAKPGAHALVFAGTRTVDLMGVACRLGGWELRTTIHWAFWNGMPHGLNVGKAIDKMRYDRAEILQVTRWIAEKRDAAGITNRAIDAAFGTNGTAGHWTSRNSQPAVPTLEQVPRLLEVLGNPGVPADIRRLLLDLNGAKGTWGNPRPDRETGAPGSNSVLQPTVKVLNPGTPILPEAAKWDGWNTELKPAVEPILLLRKPLAESTIARQVLATGTGALNIDGCRIPQGSKIWPGPQKKKPSTHASGEWGAGSEGGAQVYGKHAAREQHTTTGQKIGRYPANLVHFKKPSPKEKEAGCEALPVHYSKKGAAAGERGGLVLKCPEHGKGFTGRNTYHCGCSKVFDKAKPHNQKGVRNHHKTVKPIDLMAWCCKLVTPPGGRLMDMFGGSGTTAVAGGMSGFDVTLCELSSDYLDISKARIRHWAPDVVIEDSRPSVGAGEQLTMFG